MTASEGATETAPPDGAADVASHKKKEGLLARVGSFYSKHPWLGFVGTLASVAGIPLAAHYGHKTSSELAFRVSASRSVVVAKSQVGGLRVLHGEKEVVGDVMAVQAVLWNAGSGPARGAAVLEGLRIVTDPPTPILSVAVQSVTRSVIGMAVETSSLSAGVVPVRFIILEPGDGALIQLVYAGPVDVGLEAVGILEGQRQIRNWDTGRFSKGGADARRTWRDLPLWPTVAGVALLTGVMLFEGYSLAKGARPERWKAARNHVAIAAAIMVALLVVVVVVFVWLPQALGLTPPTAPFRL